MTLMTTTMTNDHARCMAESPDSFCLQCRRWRGNQPSGMPVGNHWFLFVANFDSRSEGCIYLPLAGAPLKKAHYEGDFDESDDLTS